MIGFHARLRHAEWSLTARVPMPYDLCMQVKKRYFMFTEGVEAPPVELEPSATPTEEAAAADTTATVVTEVCGSVGSRNQR
jgi:hypothetical protein